MKNDLASFGMGRDSGFLKKDDLLPLIEERLKAQRRSIWFWQIPDPSNLYFLDFKDITMAVKKYCDDNCGDRNRLELEVMMNTCISNLYNQDKSKENIKTFFNGFNRKILNNIVLDFLLNIFVNLYNSIKVIVGFNNNSLIKVSMDLEEVIKIENDKYERDRNKTEVKVITESNNIGKPKAVVSPKVRLDGLQKNMEDQASTQAESDKKTSTPERTLELNVVHPVEISVEPQENKKENVNDSTEEKLQSEMTEERRGEIGRKNLCDSIDALTPDTRDMESKYARFSQDRRGISAFAKEIMEKIQEWSTSKKFDSIAIAIDKLQWKKDIMTAAEWGPQLAGYLTLINSLVLKLSEYVPVDKEKLVDLAKGIGKAIQGPDHGTGLMAVKQTLADIDRNIKTRIRLGKEKMLNRELGKEILDRINSFNQSVSNEAVPTEIKEKLAKWSETLGDIKVAIDKLQNNIQNIPEEKQE
jgi:hypothetical protein